MSILIKGAEMPEEGCKDCLLVKRGQVFDICPFLKREVNGNVERGGKPLDCPLVSADNYLCEKINEAHNEGYDVGYWAGRRDYEPKWIPVSERLPDDGSEVWVTIKGSDVIKVEAGETIEQAIDRVNRIRWVTRAYWSEEEHGWNDPTFGCPLVVQPIAWMPIEKPEPYEEVQE